MTAERRPEYRRALEWLFRFSDWERGVGWNSAASPDDQWKLGRTRVLLDLAGGPDRSLRCVLIAGTKGKGSTAAMLAAILGAAGWRTGLYSQPHLHSYRERVQVGGRPIEPGRFAALVERLRPLVDQLGARFPEAGRPTTFELTTVLALLWFAEAGAELAVLEVGLGGRLDATNAVDPVLSVITTIGFDHTQILGDSLEEIAREKAGIIRGGRPVISARQRPAARRTILERCHELGSACRFVGPLRADGSWSSDGAAVARFGRSRPFGVQLAMRGVHQRQNAAVAIAAAGKLAAHGLALTPDVVRAALAATRLPGRFEVVAGSPTWVLDAAHNGDSAAALARTLNEAGLGRPRWLVLGILRDKDAPAVVRPLVRAVDGVIVTAPSSPRALSADALAEICRWVGVRTVTTASSVAEGMDQARETVGFQGTVVVTGSFSTVSDARVALGLGMHAR